MSNDNLIAFQPPESSALFSDALTAREWKKVGDRIVAITVTHPAQNRIGLKTDYIARELWFVSCILSWRNWHKGHEKSGA